MDFSVIFLIFLVILYLTILGMVIRLFFMLISKIKFAETQLDRLSIMVDDYSKMNEELSMTLEVISTE